MASQVDRNTPSVETQHFLNRVQQTIHELVPDAAIILYGSRARGDADAASDWDFLILVDQPIERNFVVRLRNQLYELELETDQMISSIIRTWQEWNSPRYAVLPFKVHVEQDGVFL